MKRVVLCSVIMAFIMTLSVSGTMIVRDDCKEMKDKCEFILTKYNNSEKISDDMEEIYDLWKEKSALLCFIVNKDKLDKTGFILSEMLDADNMDKSDFLSKMNSLMHFLEDTAEDETPKIKNIF